MSDFSYLTATTRRRLARAARSLASDFAEGRGPRLDKSNFCGCAAGETFKRAGLANVNGQPAEKLDEKIDHELTYATCAEVGDLYFGRDRVPGAVVFPLLALADELEEGLR